MTQPNLAMLKYWGYSLEDSPVTNVLFSHLKSVSWLQILDPEADAIYADPPPEVPAEELEKWKTGRKGNYFKKQRRYQRVRRVVEETRAGEFDALVVASFMNSQGILKHLIPLVKGGGQIVVYSPNIEPLAELADLYSRERRRAYVQAVQEKLDAGDTTPVDNDEDFPVNPTLLLYPMLQTSRTVEWQVLPGRTHPMMTSRGGPEGFLFTATRVIPHKGQVNAWGKNGKKRKADSDVDGVASSKRVRDDVDVTTGTDI
jgi:tRNA (adenine-N(1)-)-methyltransferase non-catalytic subunit